jgi:type IV pilus assembly protein PilM
VSLSLPKLPGLSGKGSPLGLFIDATTMKVVELNDKGSAVRAIGEIPLANGLVSAGEIQQPEVLSPLLKQLLASAGVAGRKVDIAVASPRIALRLLEVPEMPESEMKTSLAYQVGDLLPIPAAEMLVDYQPVGYLEGADGKRSRQILVIASHREQIRTYLQVAKDAGLTVRKIDSAPLALARSLRDLLAPYDPATGAAPVEGIVHIGPELTNVLVTAGGTTMFGRTLAGGADPQSLEPDADPTQLADRMFPLMEDIRNTLAFAISQVARERLSRVLLIADPQLEQVLVECLQATLGVPVQPVWVAHMADVRGVSGAESVDGTFSVPFALALNHLAPSGDHTPSLLPDEIRVEAKKRRETMLIGAGVAGVAGLLAAASVAHGGTVTKAKAEAVAAQKNESKERARLTSLTDVETSIAAAQIEKAAIVAQFAGSIDYLNMINDIADHLPPDVSIDALTLGKGDSLTLSLHGGSRGAAAATLDSFAKSPRFDDGWIDAVSWPVTAAPTQGDASTAGTAPGTAPGEGLTTFSLVLHVTPAAASGRAAEFEETK